jgi:hypothetical protein
MARASNNYSERAEPVEPVAEDKPSDKPTDKRKGRNKKNAEAATTAPGNKFNLLKPLASIFAKENRKLNLTVGSLLVLFAFYLVLSFTSYLFTWKLDQNFVINSGFLSF